MPATSVASLANEKKSHLYQSEKKINETPISLRYLMQFHVYNEKVSLPALSLQHTSIFFKICYCYEDVVAEWKNQYIPVFAYVIIHKDSVRNQTNCRLAVQLVYK